MARGRKPEEGQVRDEFLKVRLTQAGKAALTGALQEGETSAGFARDAINEKIAARGRKK